MNSNLACHAINDCPGLYVDAFGTTKLLHQNDACLILSHYHGDHYGNLPRGYSGPALIHCTPITASLLRDMHEIPSQFVVEHAYGDTWVYESKQETTKVTFYDAFHCPGAAIILIELEKSNQAHLHTGDFRYHEKMLEYPRLQKAAVERRLDTIWLDTTYALATRKYSFPSQTEAIEETARHVREAMVDQRDGSSGIAGQSKDYQTLILLCCYNIGKEKILWRVAEVTNRKLFANEKKLRMLQLCTASGEYKDNYSRYCTSNEKETNIHVVPMHLAGKVWPFFQPNYQSCAKYATSYPPLQGSYDKVVVFCPTGWSAANNWNRKNNMQSCPKTKIPGTSDTIHVEIRLIPYSEHSNLSELQTLVNDHWKPRSIVPTVYKTENEKRQILDLFEVDRNRAKQHFFQQMEMSCTKTSKSNGARTRTAKAPIEDSKEGTTDNPIVITPETLENPAKSPTTSPADLERLVSMGFSRMDGEEALRRASESTPSNVFEAALDLLVSSPSLGQQKKISGDAKKRKRAVQKSLHFFTQKPPR